MKWTPLIFGKHQGKTLPQVLLHDPDWFFWAWGREVFDDSSVYHYQAVVAHAKATSIRIPSRGSGPLVVEYKFYPDGTCVGFDLVPDDRPAHQGSTRTTRSDHIDMSIPHRAAPYDKTGNRLFLRSLKSCLFGDPAARMTRERCEAFFNDERNFKRND